jgi:hypothetical protein
MSWGGRREPGFVGIFVEGKGGLEGKSFEAI